MINLREMPKSEKRLGMNTAAREVEMRVEKRIRLKDRDRRAKGKDWLDNSDECNKP